MTYKGAQSRGSLAGTEGHSRTSGVRRISRVIGRRVSQHVASVADERQGRRVHRSLGPPGELEAPTSVSSTVRPERSSRAWTSSRSSRRNWALTPGWATCSFAAALVKFASSATVTKYTNCRRSITNNSIAVVETA